MERVAARSFPRGHGETRVSAACAGAKVSAAELVELGAQLATPGVVDRPADGFARGPVQLDRPFPPTGGRDADPERRVEREVERAPRVDARLPSGGSRCLPRRKQLGEPLLAVARVLPARSSS